MSWDRLQAPAPWPLTLVPREVDKWTEPTLSLPTDPWGGQGQWECGGGLVSEPLPRAQGAAWEARFAFLWGVCLPLLRLPAFYQSSASSSQHNLALASGFVSPALPMGDSPSLLLSSVSFSQHFGIHHSGPSFGD